MVAGNDCRVPCPEGKKLDTVARPRSQTANGSAQRPAPQPNYPAAVGPGTTNDDSTASGQPAAREPHRSDMAAARSASENGGRASNRKYARVVDEVRRVRTPWRQFQRRQVTPTASTHTTSPARTPPSSNDSSPRAKTSRTGNTTRSRSSPPTGTECATETAL